MATQQKLGRTKLRSQGEGDYRGETKRVRTAAGEEVLVRNGQGTFVYPNRSFVYSGEWVNGLKHGHGVLKIGNSTYEGSFINGELEGSGVRKWEDGTTYSGDFHLGEMEGQGVFYSPVKGEHYEGHFRANKREGRGILRTRLGDYRGNFVANRPHGAGHFLFADGSQFNGEWESGMREGEGVESLSNGDTYQGNFHLDQRHGRGLFVHGASKVVYVGEWANGERALVPSAQRLRFVKPLPQLESPKKGKQPQQQQQQQAQTASTTPAKSDKKTDKKKQVVVEEQPVDRALIECSVHGADSNPTSLIDWNLILTAGLDMKPGDAFPALYSCVVDSRGAHVAGEGGRVFRIAVSVRTPVEPVTAALDSKDAKSKAKTGKAESKPDVVSFCSCALIRAAGGQTEEHPASLGPRIAPESYSPATAHPAAVQLAPPAPVGKAVKGKSGQPTLALAGSQTLSTSGAQTGSASPKKPAKASGKGKAASNEYTGPPCDGSCAVSVCNWTTRLSKEGVVIWPSLVLAGHSTPGADCELSIHDITPGLETVESAMLRTLSEREAKATPQKLSMPWIPTLRIPFIVGGDKRRKAKPAPAATSAAASS